LGLELAKKCVKKKQNLLKKIKWLKNIILDIYKNKNTILIIIYI
jgi:hypothetical protein